MVVGLGSLVAAVRGVDAGGGRPPVRGVVVVVPPPEAKSAQKPCLDVSKTISYSNVSGVNMLKVTFHPAVLFSFQIEKNNPFHFC